MVESAPRWMESDERFELSLSTNMVANHIASILAKLHLDNRIQAAVQAVRSAIS